jgi:hypothetical protein
MGNRRPSASTTSTMAANGRSVRITNPSGPGWAPRIEWGSWWVPATIRSISPRLTPAAAAACWGASGSGAAPSTSVPSAVSGMSAAVNA